MRRRRRWLNMVALAAAVSGVYGFACWQLAQRYLRPSTDPLGLVPAGFAESKLNLPEGEVEAWTTPTVIGGNAPVFVMVHGYGGSQSFWAGVGMDLAKADFDVVIPKLPGHQDPSDATTGFGLKEARRVKTIVDLIRSTPGGKSRSIVLLGVSMGGAACWLATDMGADVDGVVTEGAFARFDDATESWLNHAFPGGSVILRPVVWIASAQSGLQPSDIIPERAAKRWKSRPALVIQGTEDRLIPMRQAELLAAAAGCELWKVEGARHAQCSDTAGREYIRRLIEFAKTLPPREL